MNVTSSVANGLQAALLLARGRADGLRYVEADMAGAARSFWAMAICLPAFVCLRLMAWTESGMPPQPAHVFALDLLILRHRLVRLRRAVAPVVAGMGRGGRWPRFIATWNWCNVVQYSLLVAFSIPGLLGAPARLDQTASSSLSAGRCGSNGSRSG